MILDEEATRKAPGEWQIWRTPTEWQAIHPDCQTQDDGLHGPMRKGPRAAEIAVRDAVHLESCRETT